MNLSTQPMFQKLQRTLGYWRSVLTAASVVCAAGILPTTSYASSHSDAPLIKQDPECNLTDVYAFISAPNGVKMLNVIIHVHPFCEPGDGAIYDRFAPDALYSINITNPATGVTNLRYDFQFSSVTAGYKSLDTILSYGRNVGGMPPAGPIQHVDDAFQNYTQTYTVTKTVGSTATQVGTGLKVPPPNTGIRATPAYNDPMTGKAISGATTTAQLDTYTAESIYSLTSGEQVFCGMRDDPFFADIPGVFDLLDPRILGTSLGQAGGGVDGFKGYNVLCYGIQIPVSQLSSSAYSDAFFGPTTGVGVYASVSRPRITLRSSSGAPTSSGPWIQVNRLGNPLFNEALVALRDKDRYNLLSPTDDIANFSKYANNPELPVLINTVFGTAFQTTNRSDLVAVFMPDVLRVDTTTGAVPLAGQPGFSRLGFIGGDTTNGKNSGWPNGRRYGDDVVDIALTAIASGPSYSTITLVGDNVPSNDQVFNQVFPYAATPNAGTRNSKDSGINAQ